MKIHIFQIFPQDLAQEHRSQQDSGHHSTTNKTAGLITTAPPIKQGALSTTAPPGKHKGLINTALPGKQGEQITKAPVIKTWRADRYRNTSKTERADHHSTSRKQKELTTTGTPINRTAGKLVKPIKSSNKQGTCIPLSMHSCCEGVLCLFL